MAERFSSGDRVRTIRTDPTHHTRLPRYARGAVGSVVEREGSHPLPDDRSRGVASDDQPVYAVRFLASDLFGTGTHEVTLALWESYLSPAGPEGAA